MIAELQEEVISIVDPRVLAIPVQENFEELIDIKANSDIVIGPSPEIPNNTVYTKMRKTVFEKLKQAQALLPAGYRFCLYEGYRSIELQTLLFKSYFAKTQTANPGLAYEELFKKTTTLVSPVTNLDGTINIPPHSTGAAIDVYLLDDNGNAYDMGIHPKDWMTDLDGSLSLTLSKIISNEAQNNRKIMSEVLKKVGFVNYPTEYWHWSYGDRYWAYQTKHPYAIYGTIKT